MVASRIISTRRRLAECQALFGDLQEDFRTSPSLRPRASFLPQAATTLQVKTRLGVTIDINRRLVIARTDSILLVDGCGAFRPIRAFRRSIGSGENQPSEETIQGQILEPELLSRVQRRRASHMWGELLPKDRLEAASIIGILMEARMFSAE